MVYYSLYVTTNLTNQSKYFGVHKETTYPKMDKYLGSGTRLKAGRPGTKLPPKCIDYQTNSKHYFNPVTTEEKLYIEGHEPDGFILGRPSQTIYNNTHWQHMSANGKIGGQKVKDNGNSSISHVALSKRLQTKASSICRRIEAFKRL